MKKYLFIARNSFLMSIIYRFHFIFNSVGNIVYIILIFFLWKSIYSNDYDLVIKGLTFKEVFIYLALASSLYVLFLNQKDWDIAEDIRSGLIVIKLLKPVDYQLKILFENIGTTSFNLITITLPTFIILFIMFFNSLNLGLNILFFLPAIFFAFLLAFFFSYIIGLSGFFTESIWGISTAKEVIILLLSGAIIPIKFFPHIFQKIILFLPFQAIYNIPLSILLNKNQTILNYTNYLLIQLFWVIVLAVITRLLYLKAVNSITINGG